MTFEAGVVIKTLRLANGLTQEQLAEGICSRTTVAMAERGERKPDWYTYRNLMFRLGEFPEKYGVEHGSKDEVLTIQKFFEWGTLISRSKHDEMKAELDKYETEPVFAQGAGLRTILYLKLCTYNEGPNFDLKKAEQTAFDALRISRPDFDLAKIPEYFLSPIEIDMLNSLSHA